MFHIKVPATSANLGPGFDAIGIALNLYNEIEAEFSDTPLDFTWENEEDMLSKEENLIYQSMLEVFRNQHCTIPNLSVHVKKCHIPIRRGLGSSSAAIVCGLTLAYAVMGLPLDKKKLSQEACLIEGHPDNVVPAVEGGLSVTILKQGQSPLTSHIAVPEELRFIAIVPPYEISTEKSRAALPDSYRRSDCIGNAARTALLVNALATKDYALLRTASEDFVHQPYRLPLMEHGQQIFDLFKNEGALGEFISGSGSTLIGVFLEKDAHKALDNIQAAISNIDDKFYAKLLEVDYEGVVLKEY